jgi:hypothetical protein
VSFSTLGLNPETMTNNAVTYCKLCVRVQLDFLESLQPLNYFHDSKTLKFTKLFILKVCEEKVKLSLVLSTRP